MNFEDDPTNCNHEWIDVLTIDYMSFCGVTTNDCLAHKQCTVCDIVIYQTDPSTTYSAWREDEEDHEQYYLGYIGYCLKRQRLDALSN